MKQSDSYDRSIHRTGRLGSILAIAWMLGIPAVMCTVYHMFPSIPDLLLFGSGLLALYVPTAISEVITYVPMLGSASYITFITGNISNLKLPCALNALEMADVEQNTDAGDAVATVAVAVSSIVTTVIIVLGVLLLVPLQPILESEPVKIAGSYMLPALYGCLFRRLSQGQIGVVSAPICAFYHHSFGGFFRCFRPALPAFFGFWVKTGSSAARPHPRQQRLVVHCAGGDSQTDLDDLVVSAV